MVRPWYMADSERTYVQDTRIPMSQAPIMLSTGIRAWRDTRIDSGTGDITESLGLQRRPRVEIAYFVFIPRATEIVSHSDWTT
jgi:hypothetical protein